METLPIAGRVLYVEDHDDTRVLMKMLLEQAGFNVTAVDTGERCLELARERRGQFDLYLLDHTFPDASGVSICASLRQFDQTTPIIFYSSRAMPQEKEAALQAGAQDYLIKPNDLFHVAEHVASWIKMNRPSPDSA
ncbi:MAG TPA: response regulator [Pyrinomonadaceae bacterium]|nr:response regulator [Pyrinomonadaceae bacterium]